MWENINFHIIINMNCLKLMIEKKSTRRHQESRGVYLYTLFKRLLTNPKSPYTNCKLHIETLSYVISSTIWIFCICLRWQTCILHAWRQPVIIAYRRHNIRSISSALTTLSSTPPQELWLPYSSQEEKTTWRYWLAVILYNIEVGTFLNRPLQILSRILTAVLYLTKIFIFVLC